MPSSLAAALAASSKSKTTGDSRPSSSLMKHAQIHKDDTSQATETKIDSLKTKLHNTNITTCTSINRVRSDDNKKSDRYCDAGEDKNIERSRKTKLNDVNIAPSDICVRSKNNEEIVSTMKTSHPSVLVKENEAMGVVFVCNIPSDSDDDDDDDRHQIIDTSKEGLDAISDRGQNDDPRRKILLSSRKSKKKKKERTKSKAIVPLEETPASNEVVFLCDIPSDDSDENDDDDKSYTQQNQNIRRDDATRQSDKGRGAKDTAVQKISSRKNLSVRTSEAVTPRSSTKTTPSANLLPISSGTGLMPTPWSKQAQKMMKSNRGDNNYTTNERNRPNNRTTSRSHHHQRTTNCSTTHEWRSPRSIITSDNSNPTPRLTPTTTMQTVVGAAQKNSTASTTDSSKAVPSPLILESTVLKGRWADEDSDSGSE